MRCDEKYKTMNQRNAWKSWVLRISNKGRRKRPKFIGMIGKMANLDSEVSEAHLKFLEKIYKLPYIKYTRLDGGETVKLQTYETSI